MFKRSTTYLLSVILTVLLSFILYTSPSQADSANDLHKKFLDKYSKELHKIENYLQSIQYLEASFIQESSEGTIVEGKFYLSRPGKMRIEYNEPSKILIIVNGRVMSYQDLELEETSYLTTNSTPASFLVRKKISFDAKDVQITDFKKDQDFISVSVIKKNKKEAGEFSLIFKQNPLEFVRMEVKNDMEQTIIVSFTNATFGEAIDNKLFTIENNKLPSDF